MRCVNDEIFECISLQDFKGALNLLKPFHKSPWTAAYLRGFCYKQIGDYKSAIRNYRDALKSSPDQALVLNAMGIAYQCLGMYDDAEYCFGYSSKLIASLTRFSSILFEINRKELHADALNNLGVTLHLKSDLCQYPRFFAERSLMAHLQALSIFEQKLKIQLAVCDLNSAHGNEDKKIECLQSLKKSRNETPFWTVLKINLAAQYFRVGDIANSNRCISNCIAMIDEENKYWSKAQNLLLHIKSLGSIH